MLKLEDIKKDLRRGDYQLLIEMVSKTREKPLSINTINSIFSGRRTNKSELAQTVLKAAQKVIANRKLLLEPMPIELVQIKSHKVPKEASQLEIFSAKQ